MLSYQHAYHAGGPADLHKHIVLAELLAQLTRKPRGITYAETHAGRGRYDLAAPEAAKTGEAAAGIARIAPDPATPFGRALAAVRAGHGAGRLPGLAAPRPHAAAHRTGCSSASCIPPSTPRCAPRSPAPASPSTAATASRPCSRFRRRARAAASCWSIPPTS